MVALLLYLCQDDKDKRRFTTSIMTDIWDTPLCMDENIAIIQTWRYPGIYKILALDSPEHVYRFLQHNALGYKSTLIEK